MKNMKNDCELIAKNNIKFKWNDKFPINSLNLIGDISQLMKKLNQNL